jgi:ATP-dependent Clp protease protease subunit
MQTPHASRHAHPPGGQPYSIFGVLDTIKSIKPDVQTYALGACYSYASMILVRAPRVTV